MISQISLDSYKTFKDFFSTQEGDIYDIINSYPYITRNKIANMLGLPPGRISARVKSLIDSGLICRGHKVFNEETGTSNETLFIKDKINQQLIDNLKNLKTSKKTVEIDYKMMMAMYKVSETFLADYKDKIDEMEEIPEHVVECRKFNKIAANIYNKHKRGLAKEIRCLKEKKDYN